MSNDETVMPEENQDAAASTDAAGGDGLANEQADTIRELCNIALGAASSNLAVIVNKDVNVPTPDIAEHASIAAVPEPLAGEEKIIVSMNFSGGVQYATAFVMKASDAKVIADMMLGGGADEPGPLNELQSSAVSEAFSQMMNASATSLASVLSEAVEVTAPEVVPYSAEGVQTAVPGSDKVISIHFTMTLDDGQAFDMVQLMNTAEAVGQIDKLMSLEPGSKERPEAPQAPPADSPVPQAPIDEEIEQPVASPSGQAPPPRAPKPAPTQAAVDPVTVQPVQFAAFDEQPDVYGEYNKNLDLVLDVTLNLTVQLGSTELSIKQILELTRGSVIELDRIAGEPVDLLANGKLIAKGEVVVIEDNFGLRITSIVSPEDRLRGLTG